MYPWCDSLLCLHVNYRWMNDSLQMSCTQMWRLVRAMVFIATLNNISAISWRSVLLVEETWVPGENHLHVAMHWQTLLHNGVSSTHADILKRTYLCQVSDTGSPEPLVQIHHVQNVPWKTGEVWFPFWSYSPWFAEKYQFLKFQFNNLSSPKANYFKFIKQ
jgi:hypothetical protein